MVWPDVRTSVYRFPSDVKRFRPSIIIIIIMITQVGSLFSTPGCLTCTMITEAGSLLTTPCYLTCTMITEVGSLLTTPCYLTCTMITEVGSLLTTPCYLTCTMITEVGSLLTTPCYLTCTLLPCYSVFTQPSLRPTLLTMAVKTTHTISELPVAHCFGIFLNFLK